MTKDIATNWITLKLYASKFHWATAIYLYCIITWKEKAMAPHSSTLAWKIPWMEEPGGLQSMGSLRVGHFHFSLSWLEKEMATHSSGLAWRIPGTEEPVGLASMGSHRVGHDWCDLEKKKITWKFIFGDKTVLL